jgi:hypothetical protein
LIALVLIAVALLIALAFWWRHARKGQNSRKTRVRDPKRPSESYQCVELRYGRDACDAVKRIGDKRFLSGEAPEIPLAGCNAAKCSCSYVHHQDRRHSDRRHPFPKLASAPPAAVGDRRTKKDRRKAAKTPSRPKTGR